MELFFSIITPCYNRQDEILLLIDSIINQSVSPNQYELIIVDDGSTDNSRDIIKNKIIDSNINIRLIKQINKGPGAARNNGMKNANGNFYLFIDSDCEADKNWLLEIIKKYKKIKFDAFGGPDSYKDNFSDLQKSIDFSMNSFLTTGGLRGSGTKRLAKFYPRSHNMGIKSSIFQKIGGFGKLRHGQDIEFSNRIINNGYNVNFLSNAIVYHKRRTSLKKFFKQVFNWGVARINLGMIDKQMLETLHYIPSLSTLSIFFLIIGSFFQTYFFLTILLILFLFLIIVSVFGSIKIKSFNSFFLLLLIIPIQTFGYGMGFIYNFINRFIFKKNEFIGFRKKYYN